MSQILCCLILVLPFFPALYFSSSLSLQRGVWYNSDLKLLTAPWLMQGINTRVVRRSNALLNNRCAGGAFLFFSSSKLLSSMLFSWFFFLVGYSLFLLLLLLLSLFFFFFFFFFLFLFFFFLLSYLSHVYIASFSFNATFHLSRQATEHNSSTPRHSPASPRSVDWPWPLRPPFCCPFSLPYCSSRPSVRWQRR